MRELSEQLTLNRAQHRTVSLDAARTVTLLSTIVFFALIIFAAAGLRGSDQYWYTAEVEQLLQGEVNIGTVAFPYHAYNNLIPPPFNHHTVTHYAVLLFAPLVGAYYAWIIVNCLATLLTGVLLYFLIAHFASPLAAAAGYAASLLLPLPFWITAQPYMESSLAPFVVAGLLLYSTARETPTKWLCLWLLFGVAYMCRTSFLVILLLIPLGAIIHLRFLGLKSFAVGFLLMVGTVGTILLYDYLFQPDPALTLSRYLNAKVPGVSDNMHVLYALTDQPIELWKLWRKSTAGLLEQLYKPPVSVQMFYIPFNLALLLSVLLMWRKTRQTDVRLTIGLLVCIGMHAATVMLRGNEFRFLHVVSPAFIAGAAIALYQFGLFQKRYASQALLTGFIALVTIDGVIAYNLRTEAAKEAEVREILASTINKHVPLTDAIMLATPGFSEKDLLFNYSIRPRLSLFMHSRFGYTPEQIEQMRGNAEANWLFAKKSSPLISELALKEWVLVEDDFPKPFTGYALYNLAPRQSR